MQAAAGRDRNFLREILISPLDADRNRIFPLFPFPFRFLSIPPSPHATSANRGPPTEECLIDPRTKRTLPIHPVDQ